MWGYYVHKEPILSSNGRTYGHELIFRKARELNSAGDWPAIRVDEDVICALTPTGFDRLTGNKRAFLNVHADTFRSDVLGSLPKHCIFQVSERDGLDKEVLLKSAVLKKQGYQIAAEETSVGRGVLPFYQVADFVRIDTHPGNGEFFASRIAVLEGLPLRRIATRVQSRQAFQECRDRGFDLFQGAFLVDPLGGSAEPVSDSQIRLMQLAKDLRSNREIGTIEEPFKNSPKLTYGLLQLINSAFFGVSVKVVSIRQAIMLLGYESLLKWVTLLLFTVDHGNNQSNPLVEKAILRGRVMESLTKDAGRKGDADSAFITGMLSLFTVLFDVTLIHLATEMSLGEEIQDALLSREGFLGALLRVTEQAERQEYERMDDDLSSLGLSVADLLSAETDAIIDCQACLFS